MLNFNYKSSKTNHILQEESYSNRNSNCCKSVKSPPTNAQYSQDYDFNHSYLFFRPHDEAWCVESNLEINQLEIVR